MKIGKYNFNSKSDFEKWYIEHFKNSNNSHMNQLWENIKIYANLKTKINHVEINKDAKGNLILEKGTLLHGIRNFNEEVLRSIAEDGIIYEGFFGDKTTTMTKGEACFFEVDKEQTMSQYYDSYNHNTKGERIGEVPFTRADKNTKEVAMLRRESGYLPREEKYWNESSKNSIAFIVNNVNDIESLASQKKKIPQFARGYSMPVGIPNSYISGIFISKDLEKDIKKIEYIKSLFPDKYITTSMGEIIYEPEKMKSDKQTEEQRDKKTKLSFREKSMQYMKENASKEKSKLSFKEYAKQHNEEIKEDRDEQIYAEINNFLKVNKNCNAELLENFVDVLIEKAYNQMTQEIQTEDMHTRIENFSKKINTIRENPEFQRISMMTQDAQGVYAKISNLTRNSKQIEEMFREKPKSVSYLDLEAMDEEQFEYTKEMLGRLGYKPYIVDKEYGRIMIAKNNSLLSQYIKNENINSKKISMKSVVENAIKRGITAKDIENSDTLEYKVTQEQEIGGVTKDD